VKEFSRFLKVHPSFVLFGAALGSVRDFFGFEFPLDEKLPSTQGFYPGASLGFLGRDPRLYFFIKGLGGSSAKQFYRASSIREAIPLSLRSWRRIRHSEWKPAAGKGRAGKVIRGCLHHWGLFQGGTWGWRDKIFRRH